MIKQVNFNGVDGIYESYTVGVSSYDDTLGKEVEPKEILLKLSEGTLTKWVMQVEYEGGTITITNINKIYWLS